MRVFYGFDSLPVFKRTVVTVGSFDGVHCGHRYLLRTLTDTARTNDGESVVITFEPHPRIALGKAEGLSLLTTLEEKIYLLEDLCIDNLIVIPFDKEFATLNAEKFIGDYLIGRIGAEVLIAGFDHRFGCDRRDYTSAAALGLEVIEVAECSIEGENVSSTEIRRLIEQGEMRRAARLLGYPYTIIGRVAHNRLQIDEPLKLIPSGKFKIQNSKFKIDDGGGGRSIYFIDDVPDGRVIITF